MIFVVLCKVSEPSKQKQKTDEKFVIAQYACINDEATWTWLGGLVTF